jgi:CRISPR-associated protein Cas1
MKSLHELPKFSDRWSYPYLERGRPDQTAAGLTFRNQDGDTPVPIDQLSLVMLGPGTTLTHAAVKMLAGNNCLAAWAGEDGIRTYAHSTGGTFRSRRLPRQAALFSDEKQRLAVAYRMYRKRFPGTDLTDKTIEQVRGVEGPRVRKAYEELAAQHGITWEGRNYDQDDWFTATGANRALSAANARLYGVCHAAIVWPGYSPALGFVHTGKMQSLVYDVADLYKTEVTVPVAFRLAAAVTTGLEREVRKECRKAFHAARLVDRILPDLAEVLDAGDDPAQDAEGLEGRAVSLADGGTPGGLPGQSQPEGAG